MFWQIMKMPKVLRHASDMNLIVCKESGKERKIFGVRKSDVKQHKA